jgi:hypothetical protein
MTSWNGQKSAEGLKRSTSGKSLREKTRIFLPDMAAYPLAIIWIRSGSC